MSKSCVIYMTTTCQKIRANGSAVGTYGAEVCGPFFFSEISIRFLTPLLNFNIPGVIHTSDGLKKLRRSVESSARKGLSKVVFYKMSAQKWPKMVKN